MRVGFFRFNVKNLVVAVLFTFTVLVLPASAVSLSAMVTGKESPKSDTAIDAQSASPDTNALLAGLSDEQVRKLLIEQLQKDGAQQTSAVADQNTDPASIFGEVLTSLSETSDVEEERAKELLASIPEFLPDLNRIFLTL